MSYLLISTLRKNSVKSITQRASCNRLLWLPFLLLLMLPLVLDWFLNGWKNRSQKFHR